MTSQEHASYVSSQVASESYQRRSELLLAALNAHLRREFGRPQQDLEVLNGLEAPQVLGPIWQQFYDKNGWVPREVRIATSSSTKRIILALQLLLLGRKRFFPEFESYLDKSCVEGPHELTNALRVYFHNGDNESADKMYLGDLQGIPVIAYTNEGETHAAGATAGIEAAAKVTELVQRLDPVVENASSAAPVPEPWTLSFAFDSAGQVVDREGQVITPLSKVAKVFGLDTKVMIEVLEKGEANWNGRKLTKQDLESMKIWYIGTYLVDGATIEATTAVSMLAHRDGEAVTAPTAKEKVYPVTISHDRLLQHNTNTQPSLKAEPSATSISLNPYLYLNAAGLGAQQQLAGDLTEINLEKIADPEMFLRFKTDVGEEKWVSFLHMAQFVGVPLWCVIEMVANYEGEKAKQPLRVTQHDARPSKRDEKELRLESLPQYRDFTIAQWQRVIEPFLRDRLAKLPKPQQPRLNPHQYCLSRNNQELILLGDVGELVYAKLPPAQVAALQALAVDA